MTNPDGNPFKKLASEFAARQKNASGATSEVKKQPSSARGGNRDADPEQRREEAAESRLFLQAVSRIRPLSEKKRGQGHRALAEALAERMKKNTDAEQTGNAAPGQESGDGRRAGSGGFRQAKAPGMRRNAEAVPMRNGMAPSRTGAGPVRGATPREENFAEMFAATERKSEESSPEEELLFAKAMQGVQPVTSRGRDIAASTSDQRTSPSVDPAKALRDVLEGRVEFALHHTDEYMEGFVVGVDPLVLARLRNGQFSPESHVDLHGMNASQAYDSLIWFFKNAYQRGMRTVVVVTGRGRNSPDGIGVLRPLLQRWLSREPFKRVVLAFCTAKPGDGGPGAVYVLLRKYKKSRGKIIWEHTPSDDDFPDL